MTWAIARFAQWHLVATVYPQATAGSVWPIQWPYMLATSLESARALLPRGDRLLDPTYSQHWPDVLEVWVCGPVRM